MIFLLFTPSLAFSEFQECETTWPQSCGVLKPDPGGFPVQKHLLGKAYSETISKLSEVIPDIKEIPEIICRSSKFKTNSEAQKYLANFLTANPKEDCSYDNQFAAIVPTLLTAKYKSGVIISLGEYRYVCINNLGNHIFYGEGSVTKFSK